MKNSLIILLIFSAGVTGGVWGLWPDFLVAPEVTLYVMYPLFLLVGLGLGSDTETWAVLKKISLKIVLVPLSVVVGTFLGVGVFSLFLAEIDLREALAIGAGFGYYSLSSVIIGQIKGDSLGVVALLCNLSREMLTLLLAPLLVKYLGKLAPIASGGATSMDTTLPVITRFSGKEYAVIAFFSGVVLTVAVPILVPLILNG